VLIAKVSACGGLLILSNYFERGRDMRHDQDRMLETVVENLGPLYGRGAEFKEAYSGSIGIKDQKDRAALEQMCRLNFDHFYERTPPGAPEDCGDERPATTFTETAMKILGPQNMGGSSTNALVYEMTSGNLTNHLSSIRNLSSAYAQNGIEYRLGGHTAEGADGDNCGCAAIDLIAGVNGVIVDPKRRGALTDLTAKLMGPEHFDSHPFDASLRKYEGLLEELEDYLPDGYQNASLDLMRKLSPDIAPINSRVGTHLGLGIFANRVEGTRLNQDLLYLTPNDLKRPFEAFGVDVWHAVNLGDNLFPYQSQKAREFITGRIMYDAGTLLAITDGSIALLEHKPRD
jgi:hypothetical protein